MTENPDFIRAICRDPHDIPLRLVYADWLEEHGESDRAEFIRVQCELVKYEGGYVSGQAARVDDLRRRERELLLEGWALWYTPFPTPTNHCGNISNVILHDGNPIHWFHRGFIERIECRVQDWVGKGCQNCDGRGCYRYNSSRAVAGYRLERCRTCRGTGHIPGHGPAIVLRQPVVEVRPTDARPNEVDSFGTPCWIGQVPKQFKSHWSSMPRGTEEQAYQRWSNAAVAWGREQAELPEIHAAAKSLL